MVEGGWPRIALIRRHRPSRLKLICDLKTMILNYLLFYRTIWRIGPQKKDQDRNLIGYRRL